MYWLLNNPRFEQFLMYPWFAAGYLDTHPGQFSTPLEIGIRAILALVLLLHLEVSSSSGDCAIGNFKEEDELSVDKCLNVIYETCTYTPNDSKNCTVSFNTSTNGTLYSAQNCTSPLANKRRCERYIEEIENNRLAYFFLFERYEKNKHYYADLGKFVDNFLSHGMRSIVTEVNFSDTMTKYCPKFQFKAKACQSLISHCQKNSELPFCGHKLFKAAIDYIGCYENPKYEHSDCDEICNSTTTKSLFGIDGVNQTRCDALRIGCTNVTSKNLLLRCEKRMNLSMLCLVERNETYALCEETIRNMSVATEVLELTLRDHDCFAPLICFEYVKQIMRDMKATRFFYEICPLEAPFRTLGGICQMLADYCLNKEINKDITRGNSYCGNYMKYAKKKEEEIVVTTAAFNGWVLMFVLGQIVVMAAGAFAGARPYLDNKQLKTEHLKGEQKKRAESLQKKRNHFTERDICVNFHKMVLVQDSFYFGYMVYEACATNDHSFSLFFLVLWAVIFPNTFKTAKHLNSGLKANWDQDLWTHARHEYAEADNICLILTWLQALLVWRKYNRFDKLWEYRVWPVFVAMAMAFGFCTVKIMIRYLLPLSVNKIVLDHKPQIPPKERRRVIHNIQKFLSLPYAEKDKDACRKRRVAEKKLNELLQDAKPKKRVKVPRKKPVSKSKATTEKTTSLNTFWKKCMGNNTTTVVNEEQAAKSKTTTKPKKQKNGKNKGRKAKTDKPKKPPVLGNKNSPGQKKDSKLAKESKPTDPQNVAAKTGKKNQVQPTTQKKKAAAKEKKVIKNSKHENQQKPLPKDKSTAAKTKKDKKKKSPAPDPKALPPKPKGGAKNRKKK